MFREMRRNKQVMSEADTIRVLESCTAGVLACSGDDDYPYAVPVSYVYADGKIYFHSAKTGHKLDAIARGEKVSFCVIETDQIVPEELTTYFRSVIAFGRARILEDREEKLRAIQMLGMKYSAAHMDKGNAEINNSFNAFVMVEIAIDHMTGKEAIEFVRAREK